MEVCNSGISGNENQNKKDESKSALLVQDAGDKLHRQPTSTSQIPAEEIERLRKMGEDLCRAVEEIAEPKPLDPDTLLPTYTSLIRSCEEVY